jgi:hypothetical protein
MKVFQDINVEVCSCICAIPITDAAELQPTSCCFFTRLREKVLVLCPDHIFQLAVGQLSPEMEGYAKIAWRMSVNPDLTIFRQFQALNAQNLTSGTCIFRIQTSTAVGSRLPIGE